MAFEAGIQKLVLAAVLNVAFFCVSLNGQKYYRAAVFEPAPFYGTPIRKIAEQNLGQFQLATQKASSEGADIIVFPEDGIFINPADYAKNRSELIGEMAENVPDPKLGIFIPCDQPEFTDQYVLRSLSCMAKENKIFLVANMIDQKICSKNINNIDDATYNCSPKRNCPKDGFYLYNTNVVFNRLGQLVARYHKKHLYNEPGTDASKCPDDGYFETDFGPFVTFICFDMLFKESEDSLRKTNAKNLAFSTYWYDNTPFSYFGVVYQKAYAYNNEINVISANDNVPGTGTVGSGMFSGTSGTVLYTYEPDYRSRLLISNMPKQPTGKLNLDELNRKKFLLKGSNFEEVGIESNFKFADECEVKVLGMPKSVQEFKDNYRCDSISLNKFKFKKLEKREDTMKLCHGSFCCSLCYKAKSMDEDYYLGITKGAQAVLLDYKAKVCFISRCKSKSDQCDHFLLHSNTVFEYVNLEGNFREKYVLPFAVDSGVQFTNDSQWSFNKYIPSLSYKNLNMDKSLLFLAIEAPDY